ncbi:hypothetical protein [Bacteroides nordii]|uniref:hypothetical protein n=1 Tax=Bacteroides nordii TaxID=291645 RepID=UPI00242CD3A7|nr:hypothetical protein [Bacteroides nordii]
MKKIIQYMVAGLLLMMVNTSCKDNENWRIIPYEPEPPQTINITGTGHCLSASWRSVSFKRDSFG